MAGNIAPGSWNETLTIMKQSAYEQFNEISTSKDGVFKLSNRDRKNTCIWKILKNKKVLENTYECNSKKDGRQFRRQTEDIPK